MIGVELLYRLSGTLFAIVAWLNLRDRSNSKRYRGAIFWGAYAANLIFGAHLSDFENGCLVVVVALVGGVGTLGRGVSRTTSFEERARTAAKLGNKIFVPALAIPALTATGAFVLRYAHVGVMPLFDVKNVSVIAFGLAVVLALVLAVLMLRQPVLSPLIEGRSLVDMIGWAAVLPQMLAALGALFATAGVGDRIAELIGRFIPLDSGLAVVCTYTIGMALFAVVMGNAFAAFPVMTAAVGIPLIVRRLGGDAVIMSAIGMLSGFCGTLMTPMAANFNIVPAALLDLPDRNGVIRVQLATAVLVLVGNTALMYLLVFLA